MAKNSRAKDTTREKKLRGESRGLRLTSLGPLLPMLVLVFVLLVNAIYVQFDGTGKESVGNEFHRSTTIYKYAPKDTTVDSLSDLNGTLPYFSMQVAEDDKVTAEYAGCGIEGKILQDWSKGGNAYYYAMSTSSKRSSVRDFDGASSLYYVRIIQPVKTNEDVVMKKWVWVLHNVMGDTSLSNWFTLNPDGSAVIGYGELDYEQATEEQISQAEEPATWRVVSESEPHTFVVEGKETGYLISLSDS